MNRFIAIVLILAGIGLGIAGFNKLDNNSTSIEIGDLELSAGDKAAPPRPTL